MLRAVCQFLDVMEAQGKCWYWRQNNSPTFDRTKGVYRAANGPGYKYGVADVVACIGGRLVAFEVKCATGRQSDHQKRFEDGLVRSGGQYILVRSVDDVLPLFKSASG